MTHPLLSWCNGTLLACPFRTSLALVPLMVWLSLKCKCDAMATCMMYPMSPSHVQWWEGAYRKHASWPIMYYAWNLDYEQRHGGL